MSQVLKIHFGPDVVTMFKYHFMEEGELFNTRLGDVISRGYKDKHIIYEPEEGNVYIDQVSNIFGQLHFIQSLDVNFPPPEYFFQSTSTRSVAHQPKVVVPQPEVVVSHLDQQTGGNQNVEETEDLNTLISMFEEIDTVASPSNDNQQVNTNALVGGTNTEIDELVNNIHSKLNSGNSYELIQNLSNDKNIMNIIADFKLQTESPAVTLQMTDVETQEKPNSESLKTDTEYQNSNSSANPITPKFIDLN